MYIRLGGHGVYYQERLDGVTRRQSAPQWTRTDLKGVAGPEVTISTAEVSSLTDASADSTLERINSAAQRLPRWPWVLLGSALLCVGVYERPFIAALLLFAGLIASALVHSRDVRRRTTPLLYELSEEAERRFGSMNETLVGLARARRLWRIDSSQQNFDWKRHAGASSFIRRHRVALGLCRPPFIATNVATWCLQAGNLDLHFFPDRVLARQGSRFGAIAYGDFAALFSPARFIEDSGVPSDAQVIGHTWRYVRRDGGPDRRFANNRQIPVVLYGMLQLRSSAGLNVHLHVSDQRLAEWFAHAFREATGPLPHHAMRPGLTPSSGPASGRRAAMPSDILAAYQALDVSPDTSLAEVERSYRNLAKLYHPDKVHHLAPDFRALATARMQDLNLAYDRIRCYGEPVGA
jgi:hypothetical protein